MSLSLSLSTSRFPSLLVARSRVEQVLGRARWTTTITGRARVQATIAEAHYHPDRRTNTIITAPAVAFSVSFRPAIPTLRRCRFRYRAKRALLDLCPSPTSPRPLLPLPPSASFPPPRSSSLRSRASVVSVLPAETRDCTRFLSLSLPRSFFFPLAYAMYAICSADRGISPR